jgi:small-conductance mechanosensitive channel
VVIAIIGVLIALLLPVAQTAHKTAKRAQNANNKKQSKIILHSHHNVNLLFLPHGLILYLVYKLVIFCVMYFAVNLFLPQNLQITKLEKTLLLQDTDNLKMESDFGRKHAIGASPCFLLPTPNCQP